MGFMAVDSVANLVRILKKYRLLEPEQFRDLGTWQNRCATPKEMARALVARDWLTPFQVNQIFLGKYAGLVLGSYLLLERLGEGGMGTVFKARHRTMDRIVAVKVIRKERLNHPEAVGRFRREIKVAAQLNHPNIVKAFDADEVGGTHLLVMEYVEGTDLAKLLKQQGRLPIPAACEYVRQAALGLQHAQECGLVHRDIKPLNLLIATPRNEPALVKILDMGLARIQPSEDGAEVSTFLTQEGAVMGSPDYIAPEQAMGAHNVDIRADLYSLGCTFYHMLAGQVPFPGGTLGAKLVRHKLEEPERIERLRPEVPPALAAIVHRLMAKRPEDRYQTPAEVAAVLGQLIARGFQVPVPALQGVVQGPLPSANRPAPIGIAGLAEGPAPSAGSESFSALTATDSAAKTDPSWHSRRRAEQKRWLLLNLAGGAALLLFLGLLVVLLMRSGSPPAPPGEAGSWTGTADPNGGPLAGFVPLFNGKTLEGWDIKAGPPDSWEAKDGLLVCTGTAKNGWLATQKTYRDFALRLEWRVPVGGLSGVYVRCPSTGKPAAQAIEIQILDDTTPGRDTAPERQSGSIYTLVAPRRALFKGPNQWNLFEMVCQGDQLKLSYNGEEALNVDLTKTPLLAAKAREGYIALQSQGKPVEFRNLSIKDLSNGTAPAPEE
jgi:serine/threonine protein kinase